MYLKMKVALVVILVSTVGLVSCQGAPERPAGASTVSEVLDNPAYDSRLEVYGRVASLGNLLCPCFRISSGGDRLWVKYGLMVDATGQAQPDVDVDGIENGDWVLAIGELKREGPHTEQNEFWLWEIQVIER